MKKTRSEVCLEIMDGIKRCGVKQGDFLNPKEVRTAIVAVAGGTDYKLKSYQQELCLKGFFLKRDGGFYVRRFE